MTTKQHELLSAYVDGELTVEELDQLLALMNSDDQARTAYQRYQFTSDFIHGFSRSGQPVDLVANMTDAMAAEATYSLTADASKPKAKVIALPDWFWKQTAGLAAAASIGALAVLSVINQPQTATTELAEASANLEQTNTAALASISNPNRWTVGEDEVEDRLNNYLVDHNEYAGASGLFSYARVVSYGEE